jgi:bifunctional NMN adenylyltransferase/nudix hydrolase
MTKIKIGVIIGRFQTPFLHKGHTALIDSVVEKTDKVMIFIGDSPAINTMRNPLDYITRRYMIDSYVEETFEPKSDFLITQLMDQKEDAVWSAILDQAIIDGLLNWELAFNDVEITLYGGRDCFSSAYSGIFTCEIIETEVTGESSTKYRELIKSRDNAHFRAGMIYASKIRYPRVHPTVDIAVCNYNSCKILLGKKSGENQWRLIGGFVDPTDIGIEEAAIRELKEETGICTPLSNLLHQGSIKVDDWRYRSEPNERIMTSLFVVECDLDRTLKANDDIVDLKWFDVNDVTEENVTSEHWGMIKFLKITYFKLT